ncbi:MAG: DegT/DnrJ/EryC1/StrS family aminotransferase [Anaerolineae bacterium]|nr:DegT/DnrJ/EryC1/StrS family aminotransferase [Anaerolineae bacterium]
MHNFTIPVADPRAGYLAHQAEIDATIASVLARGRYILGPETEAFEAEFAAYIGLRHGIGVGSGTAALHLALRACGVSHGDEVITTAHTAVATVAAIELCGAKPVLIDIDPDTYTLNVDQLESVLNTHTKAIIPVHLYGHPAQIAEIVAIARRHGVYVIEDCAQSPGAVYQGFKTGTWGDMAAFSFYPTKNLGALGDGGMILTNDAYLAEQTRLLREYGWRDRYISAIPGHNSRLDELQAAILRVKLRYLPPETAQRIHLAQVYVQKLAETDLKLPVVLPGCVHVYHLFVVRSQQRDALQAYLSDRHISSAIHYPRPVHLQPAYQGRLTLGSTLTESEQAAQEVLSLPLYPQLSGEAINRVVEAIYNFEADRDLV